MNDASEVKSTVQTAQGNVVTLQVHLCIMKNSDSPLSDIRTHCIHSQVFLKNNHLLNQG